MKIGELAERSSCLVETIRYYERVGLLMRPERATNNYRTYTESHSDRLSFIRHCRALDMSLDEIRMLLDFRDRPQAGCAGVNDALDKHFRQVVERIEARTPLEGQLRELRSRCVVDDTARSCAILRALGTDACGEGVGHRGHV